MDFIRTAMEIGICETVNCIEGACAEWSSLERPSCLPSVSRDEASSRIEGIAEALMGIGVGQLLVLGPELALLECLSKRGFNGRVYVCLSRELDGQTKRRIGDNVPPGIDVKCVDEGDFPPGFLPSTAAVVAFGFGGANTAFLPGYQHRQLELYRAFAGPVILACIASENQGERPLGWVASPASEAFNAIIY